MAAGGWGGRSGWAGPGLVSSVSPRLAGARVTGVGGASMGGPGHRELGAYRREWALARALGFLGPCSKVRGP